MDKYYPITICMNPKFDSKGLKIHILEQLTIYSDPITQSNYQNYIDQSKPYQCSKKIDNGLLYQMKQNHNKVLICICMYNERMEALDLTLNGIFKNIEHLNTIGITPNQIGVVIIQDGILKCQDQVIDYYSDMDSNSKLKYSLKQRINIIKNEISHAQDKMRYDKVVQNDNFPETIPKKVSLLYQNKWQPPQVSSLNQQNYLNLLTCFKHINGKKLSSHAWFFQGFCRYLKPQFCILLDVGTVPQQFGVINLIKGMQQDPKIGGVSGFMGIDINFSSYENQVKRIPKQLTQRNINLTNGEDTLLQKSNQLTQTRKRQTIKTIRSTKYLSNKQKNCQTIVTDPNLIQQKQGLKQSKLKKFIKSTFFSVQKAQQIQYILSHFLDKNAQSFTGFLHVLPGAWSGYRLSALHTNSTFQKDILEQKYFKTLIQPNIQQGQSGYKFANMYLAEDRILSLAIYCHKDSHYYLKYIPNAKANTDPMKTHYDLIIQRRRWINSSNFAYKYVLANYQFDFDDSQHSIIDFILIKIGIFISSSSYFNVYFIPCLYLFVLYSTIINNGIIKSPAINKYLAMFISIVYIITLLICIGGSMIGSEWIKQIYYRNSNYSLKKNAQGKPIKKQNPSDGPAIYVSYVMAFITYVILLTVTIMISKILYNGIIKFVHSGAIDKVSLAVAVLLILNVGCYLFILLLHLFTHPKEILQIITGYLSYMTYQGAYTHTMVIYSFCNIHDVSWGTKGGTGTAQKKYEKERLMFVSSWMFWNTLICFLFFFVDFVLTIKSRQYTLLVIAIYSTVLLCLRTLFAIMNHFKFYVCKWKKKQNRVE